jgi:hypothetical protein
MSCIYILKKGKRKGLYCSIKTNDVFCSRHCKFLTDEIRSIAKSLKLTKEQLEMHSRPKLKDRRQQEIEFCNNYIKELEDDLKQLLEPTIEELVEEKIVEEPVEEEPRKIIEYKAGPSAPISNVVDINDELYLKYLHSLQKEGHFISFDEYIT